MWLWQFQNFTNKKPCVTWLCTHFAWMGCAVVHKAPMFLQNKCFTETFNTGLKHQRPQTAAFW